jgi:tetratricopeptide (TPR) repeat protein
MPRDAASSGRRLRWLLVLPALLLSLTAVAEAPEDAYTAGVEAFEVGAYRQAIDRFLHAQSLGMDEPALHYNLGASYFRLGAFGQARQSFIKAAGSPEIAPLAYYNLGLTSLQLGDEDEARAWFDLTLDTTDQPALRALAGGMLERLVAGDAAAARVWNVVLAGGLGHDSNVLLISDDDSLGGSDKSDFFLDLFGYAERGVWNDSSGDFSVQLDASAWLLRHASLDEYDMGALRAGGTLEHAGETWISSGGLHGAWSLLDSKGFTREALFSLRASRRLPAGLLRLRYELATIEAIDDRYRYLDGARQRAEGRMTWFHNAARLHLHYHFEHNDREDLAAPLFTSFSPTRNALSLIADIPLHDIVELRTELQYTRSRYRDPNELAGGGAITRNDDRIGLFGRLAYRPPAGGELSFEYRYTRNDSTIPVYDYSRHRFMAGVLVLY